MAGKSQLYMTYGLYIISGSISVFIIILGLARHLNHIGHFWSSAVCTCGIAKLVATKVSSQITCEVVL